MLNEQEKLTIRVAVGLARREGREEDEIHKLAKGFSKTAAEVRTYWLSVAGDAPAPAPTGVDADSAPSKNLWTPEQVEQLRRLRAEGKGPTEIARIMGLDKKRVVNKLSRIKSESVREESPPLKEEAVEEIEPPAPSVIVPLADALNSARTSISGLLGSPVESESPNNDSPLTSFPELIQKRPMMLASELTNLMKSLEYAYPPVAMGYLEANQTEGWAKCHFTAAGTAYEISLRREDVSE